MKNSGGQRNKGTGIPEMEVIPTVFASGSIGGAVLFCCSEFSFCGESIYKSKSGAFICLFRGGNDHRMRDGIFLFRGDRDIKADQCKKVVEVNRKGGR